MAAIRLNVSIPHTLQSLTPALALYLPAAQAVHVELPASEYVPVGQELEPLAPTRASCVTDPVVVQVVEASMGPSYTEW